tara:strand:+ start:12970 stop:13674 length:705 start_codon:yes stop_codon:yes gene_type:complete
MIKGINLGSGSNWSAPGWIGLDELNGNYLDENSVLPFIDNSVENAYSCHFFEHVNDKTSINLFDEIYRVLKPGGCFRIVVPDFELIHKECLESGMKIFNEVGFTGRPEWKRNQVEFNVANCLFHYIANYDDGTEGTPEFYRGPPKISKEEADKIIHMNTKDLCDYLYARIPIHDNIRTQHISFWNMEKFSTMFKKYSKFQKLNHMQSIIPEIASGQFDNWKDRSRVSLYVEGVK